MANDNDNQGNQGNNQGKKNKEDETGEGNRDADRRYREATEEYVKSGRPDAAGREAQRSMDDERQRRDLEEAERRARSGSQQPGKSAGNPRGPGNGKRY